MARSEFTIGQMASALATDDAELIVKYGFGNNFYRFAGRHDAVAVAPKRNVHIRDMRLTLDAMRVERVRREDNTYFQPDNSTLLFLAEEGRGELCSLNDAYVARMLSNNGCVENNPEKVVGAPPPETNVFVESNHAQIRLTLVKTITAKQWRAAENAFAQHAQPSGIKVRNLRTAILAAAQELFSVGDA